MSKHVAHDLKQ